MAGLELPSNFYKVTMDLAEDRLHFIAKHITDSSWRSSRKQKRAALLAAWSELQVQWTGTREIVTMLSEIARNGGTDGDAVFLREMDLKVQRSMGAVRSAKIKNLDDALRVITAAKTDMAAHYTEAMNYEFEQTNVGGRSLDTELAIIRIKKQGQVSQTAITQEFNTKLNAALNAMKEETGTADIEVGLSRAFYDQINPLARRIEDIPQIGDSATPEAAQAEVDTVLAAMRKLLNGTDMDGAGFLEQVSDLEDDPRRPIFIEQTKRRTELEGKLRICEAQIDRLERWDCAQTATMQDALAVLKGQIDANFLDFGDIDPSAADTYEADQKNLIERATRLQVHAGECLASEGTAFETRRAALETQLNKLVAAMNGISKISSRQKDPIMAHLDVIKSALNGTGGYNIAALDPVEKLISDAVQTVRQAVNNETINGQIEAVLDRASTKASQYTDAKKNPIGDVFTELKAKVKEYKSGYKDQPINEAMAGAVALHKEIETEETRNQQLIRLRAGIKERIDRREEQLGRFNTSFREMLTKAENPVQDYNGSFRKDLDTCIHWNATKTDPNFYTTIDATLDRIRDEMRKKSENIALYMRTSSEDAVRIAGTAGEALRNKMRDLNVRRANGEDVSAEIAEAKRAFEDATAFLDAYTELSAEMMEAEAIERKTAADREAYLAQAPDFIEGVETELGSAPMSDYADEVKPQVDRVKATLKLIKGNKDGANPATALSELSFVTKFVDGVRKRGAKTDKSALQEIGPQWSAALSQVVTAQAKLVTEVSGFEDTIAETEGVALDASVKAEIDAKITALVARAASAELKRAGELMAADIDRQARKAARETALSEIRRIRAALMDDPVFQKCVLNPFGVPIGSAAANRLKQIELNVLRGI